MLQASVTKPVEFTQIKDLQMGELLKRAQASFSKLPAALKKNELF